MLPYVFCAVAHQESTVGVIAQPVEHCTGIAEVRVRVLVNSDFFRPIFPYCLSSVAKLRRLLASKYERCY